MGSGVSKPRHHNAERQLHLFLLFNFYMPLSDMHTHAESQTAPPASQQVLLRLTSCMFVAQWLLTWQSKLNMKLHTIKDKIRIKGKYITATWCCGRFLHLGQLEHIAAATVLVSCIKN